MARPLWAGDLFDQLERIIGAEERTRTSTGLPPLAPEASVSTNFTTSAQRKRTLPGDVIFVKQSAFH